MTILTLEQLYLITGADVAFGLFEQIDDALRKTKDADKIKLADDLKKFCIDANMHENDLSVGGSYDMFTQSGGQPKEYTEVTTDRLMLLHAAKAALPADKEIQQGLTQLIAALPEATKPATVIKKPKRPSGPK